MIQTCSMIGQLHLVAAECGYKLENHQHHRLKQSLYMDCKSNITTLFTIIKNRL